MFMTNRPGRLSEPRRCLRTTNRIDNGYSVLRDRVRRVKNGPNGSMALCGTAVALDALAKGFRRIMGSKHLWVLNAEGRMDEPLCDQSLLNPAKASESRIQPGSPA
jgi:hypothetical protein